MRQSDFIQFLTAHGLTAADGTRTIDQLARQYGVGRWFGFIDVVYLPLSPLFRENREPYYVRCHRPTTLVPPAEFCCDFDFTGDGFRNHQLALARFSTVFGTPEKGIAVNTWSHNAVQLAALIVIFPIEKKNARVMAVEIVRTTTEKLRAEELLPPEFSVIWHAGEPTHRPSRKFLGLDQLG
jgi:hypothetical protein